MADRQRIQWIEIDIPYCSRVWGVGACDADLSVQTPRKCRQTYVTCGAVGKAAFDPGIKTMILTPSLAGLPVGVWPVLSGRIQETEATVNIAGADPNLSAFGRRGTVDFTCTDPRSNDLWFDKYYADRISGAASLSAVGYDPAEAGTLFTKLKAWWPYYAGRACRVKDGWLENGILTADTTRHYILTEFETDKPGAAQFKGRDILDVAGNKRALCPKPSRGKLSTAIGPEIGATATLTPSTVGGEYASSGRAVIGSEIVAFIRSGDVMTFTARGLSGTAATGHSALASVQQTKRWVNVRADVVAEELLTDFAPVPDANIPTAEWSAEMNQGAAGLLLTTEVTAPTDVDKLMAELALLGLSFWWNADDQEVGLKTNRPIFDDVTWEITDGDIVKDGLSLKARDDKRLTEVLFQSVQIDETRGLSDDNFLRYEYTIDGDAKGPNAYADARLKVEKIRWINSGNDALMRVLALRYLNLFSTAPQHVTVRVRRDKYDAVRLTDVVFISSKLITDPDGLPERKAFRVISKKNVGPGVVELLLQRYLRNGRYARFLRDDDPNDYTTASAEVKARGFYFVSKFSPTFPDGTGPYVFA